MSSSANLAKMRALRSKITNVSKEINELKNELNAICLKKSKGSADRRCVLSTKIKMLQVKHSTLNKEYSALTPVITPPKAPVTYENKSYQMKSDRAWLNSILQYFSEYEKGYAKAIINVYTDRIPLFEEIAFKLYMPTFYKGNTLLKKFSFFIKKINGKITQHHRWSQRKDDGFNKKELAVFKLYFDLINGYSIKKILGGWGFSKKIIGIFLRDIEKNETDIIQSLWKAYISSKTANFPNDELNALIESVLISKISSWVNIQNKDYVFYIQEYVSFLVRVITPQRLARREVTESKLTEWTDYILDRRPAPGFFEDYTYNRLVEESGEYHRAMYRPNPAINPNAFAPREYTWESFFKTIHFVFPFEEGEKKFVFTELVTSNELREEGRDLHHCVGGMTYASSCANGNTRIVSISFVKNNISRRICTLEIGTNTIKQAKSFCNKFPPREVRKVIRMWAKLNGVKRGTEANESVFNKTDDWEYLPDNTEFLTVEIYYERGNGTLQPLKADVKELVRL